VDENGHTVRDPVTKEHHMRRVALHHYSTKSLEVRRQSDHQPGKEPTLRHFRAAGRVARWLTLPE
jgi:hypothetical protein